MSKVPVAVIGASGYSGAELLRLLLFHDQAEIACLTSRQAAGRRLAEEQPRLRGIAKAETLTFVEPTMENLKASGAKLAFLALPHGVAYEFAEPLLADGWRVIDLSDDFRVSIMRNNRGFTIPVLVDGGLIYNFPVQEAKRIFKTLKQFEDEEKPQCQELINPFAFY